MLVLQATNAGVRRSGYEATVMHGEVLQEASGACSAAATYSLTHLRPRNLLVPYHFKLVAEFTGLCKLHELCFQSTYMTWEQDQTQIIDKSSFAASSEAHAVVARCTS